MDTINTYDNIIGMAVDSMAILQLTSAARCARNGWPVAVAARVLRPHRVSTIGHASRVENGKQPPTEKLAAGCDAAFPNAGAGSVSITRNCERGLKCRPCIQDWSELEEKAAQIRDWWPSIVSGLLQTEDYARALLSTYPGVTAEAVTMRLAAPWNASARLFARDIKAWFIVDELSLYRWWDRPRNDG